MKNIEITAQVYAGLNETAIDYYPQKGLYTALSYAFTDRSRWLPCCWR